MFGHTLDITAVQSYKRESTQGFMLIFTKYLKLLRYKILVEILEFYCDIYNSKKHTTCNKAHFRPLTVFPYII